MQRAQRKPIGKSRYDVRHRQRRNRRVENRSAKHRNIQNARTGIVRSRLKARESQLARRVFIEHAHFRYRNVGEHFARDGHEAFEIRGEGSRRRSHGRFSRLAHVRDLLGRNRRVSSARFDEEGAREVRANDRNELHEYTEAAVEAHTEDRAEHHLPSR